MSIFVDNFENLCYTVPVIITKGGQCMLLEPREAMWIAVLLLLWALLKE